MELSKTWNVDKYKSEFESEEHWALRKKFMETHKDKFPEDKLVCLARVFFNIEFLGCRYPEKTMQLVSKLSEGVADEHREKQKGKLKRTFVQASDAAEAKIKRGPPPGIEPPRKVFKTAEEKPSIKAFQYTSFVHADVVTSEPPLESGPFPGFILFENCNVNGQLETCPVNILTHSSDKSTQWRPILFYFPPEQNKTNNERYCQVKLNNKVLSSGTGMTGKEAKVNAAREGLRILRQTNYTIQVKHKFFSDAGIVTKTGSGGVAKEVEKPLPQDNIGSKIMQRMGWTGSGLGKNKQGIQEPVKAATEIMRRSGFGSVNQKQFHAKFRKMFMDYAASDSDNDLVFASDFSSEERKVLHKLAQSLKLKTQSYGKQNERHLVVNKLFPLPVLLKSLLENNGESDKYVLIRPTGESNLRGVVCNLDEGQPEEESLKQISKLNNGDSSLKSEKRKLTQELEILTSHITSLNQTEFVRNEMKRIMSTLSSLSVPATIESSEPIQNNNKVMEEQTEPACTNKGINSSYILPSSNENLPTFIGKADNESMSADSTSVSVAAKLEQPELFIPSVESMDQQKSGPQAHCMEGGFENNSKPSLFTLDGIGEVDNFSDDYFTIWKKLETEDSEIQYFEDRTGELKDENTSVIDNILKERKESIQEVVKNYKELIEIYIKNKKFSKKERKMYLGSLKTLNMLTGICIPSCLNPELNIDNIISGKVRPSQNSIKIFKKKERLGIQYKCEALGALLTNRDPLLKSKICTKIKTQMEKEVVSKKIRRFVRKEFQKVGSEYLMKTHVLAELKNKLKCLEQVQLFVKQGYIPKAAESKLTDISICSIKNKCSKVKKVNKKTKMGSKKGTKKGQKKVKN